MVVAVVLVVAVPYSSLDFFFSLCVCGARDFARAFAFCRKSKRKGVEYNSMWHEGGKWWKGMKVALKGKGGGE